MYGSCELIFGSMYCGKSEELMRRLKRVQLGNREYALFKPSIDDRYGKHLVATHASNQTSKAIESILQNHVIEITKQQIMEDINQNLEGSMPAIIVDDPKEILTHVQDKNVDVVGIDELQFFDKDIIPVIKELIKKGKRIICAGLDMYADGEPFGEVIPYVACISKHVDKLHAVCVKCGSDAVYSHKISDCESNEKGIIDVGSNGKYIAVCEHCRAILTND